MKKIHWIIGLLLLLSLLVQCAPSGTSLPQRTYEPQTIIALGDSLTYGEGVSRDQSYPSLLQNKLNEEGYENFTVVNRGISGETSEQALGRIGFIIQENPDVVILTTGGNDLLRRLSVSDLETHVGQMVQLLRAADIDVLLGAMQAPPLIAGDYGREFNKVYQNVADTYELAQVPNFLKGVQGKPSLNKSDLIHPNAEGYEIIVEENVWPSLLQVIGE